MQDAVRQIRDGFEKVRHVDAIDPRDEALQKIRTLVAEVQALNIAPTTAINSIGRILITQDREVRGVPRP